jgi:hypothetical protein
MEKLNFGESENDTETMRANLDKIVESYFPDDTEFYAGFDDDDLLGALYGALLEAGQDPDGVFQQYNLTE